MATQQARLAAFITALGADIKTLFQHVANVSNPHGTTKSQVGLGNVDNTSDALKPISSATQTALDGKTAVGHSHSMSDVAGLTAAIPAKAEAYLTSQQVNSTVTPAVLTGHTFVVPPGKSLNLKAMMVFQSAATTTGAGYGIRVAQGAGADGNVRGVWSNQVQVSGLAAATGLRSGGRFNVAAGANTLGETLGTGVSATGTDHVAIAEAVLKNYATNASATVTVEFRSEVATSGITAQIGSGALGLIL